MSVFSKIAFSATVSACDYMHFGSAISLRNIGRFASSFSVLDNVSFGSSLSVRIIS
jgi:hypothetical protein